MRTKLVSTVFHKFMVQIQVMYNIRIGHRISASAKLLEQLMEHAGPLPVATTAIDKIIPDIVDYLTPADVTIQRFKHFVGIDMESMYGRISSATARSARGQT